MAKINPPEISLQQQVSRNSPDRSQVKDRHFIPEPYKKVAEGMEKQFAEYMLEQMDRSVDRNEEASSAMDYYDSVMREQRAQAMANNNELGLQKVILDQIYPERLRNQFAYQRYLSSVPALKDNRPTIGPKNSNQVPGVDSSDGGSHE